ncbi:WecB/TagA/CpsF family glycosyltransferase [Methyloversatilis discipulorum]|uniref:WecB/TagA/CpsF family glycosyltransferase n=1 Tax=Methyloversatilis discipulorum TaxID=1119528 RepID=UPI0009DA2EB1|nr:WecB/TagA/CpsF family glycosyltransferase [Methyloversatilis discipulorum]
MKPNEKRRIFGIDIDALDMAGTLEILEHWISTEHSSCRYVVTPNVDHVVKLEKDEGFRTAYSGASLVLADGKPVVLASRVLGLPLPGTVPGSDLVPALFAHFQTLNRPLSVFLLGAAPGVGLKAAERIQSSWSCVQIVGVLSPPLGFEHDLEECDRICEAVTKASPDVLVLGLGAPKQELWVSRFHTRLNAKVALCVGATIDFLAGEKSRAPKLMRTLGLEWLHRMASEPRRLVKRYIHDAYVFPRLLIYEVFKKI